MKEEGKLEEEGKSEEEKKLEAERKDLESEKAELVKKLEEESLFY